MLELSVSQALLPPAVDEANAAVCALIDHQQELADAVRSLQASLRLALDDLADEQEGLQDALVVQHAHTRSENDALKDQLSRITEQTTALEGTITDRTTTLESMITGRTATLEGILQTAASDLQAAKTSITQELADAFKKTRNAVLSEVRDDWRSLIRHIDLRAEQEAKEAVERDALLATAQNEEIQRLVSTMSQFAESHDVMKEIRAELGIFRDEDAIPKLKSLRAEVQSVRDQIADLEKSWLWRLARSFRRPPV